MTYEAKFRAMFKHGASGVSLHIDDALVTVSTYTLGGSLVIAFRNEAELEALLEAAEQEQAARTGDANTPWQDEMDDPKTDERKTEAWLEGGQ